MVSSVSAIRSTGLTAVSVPDHPTMLLRQITSGQLWEIAPDAVGGLLLIRPFYVDFAGPGAAVGGTIDEGCTQVIPLGRVQLRSLSSLRDREDAIDIRATYADQLVDIAQIPTAIERATALIHLLHQWLPGNLALLVSAPHAAGLAGVLPDTINRVWHVPHEGVQGGKKAIAPDFSGFSRSRMSVAAG